jgi:glutaredoxin 3
VLQTGLEKVVPKIDIYTKKYCPYCALAKSILHKYPVRYAQISLTENPAQFGTMIKRSDGRRTVPQVFIDGIGIGGADALSLLEERGQLAEMLGIVSDEAA